MPIRYRGDPYHQTVTRPEYIPNCLSYKIRRSLPLIETIKTVVTCYRCMVWHDKYPLNQSCQNWPKFLATPQWQWMMWVNFRRLHAKRNNSWRTLCFMHGSSLLMHKYKKGGMTDPCNLSVYILRERERERLKYAIIPMY